jgi:hypothetical protein
MPIDLCLTDGLVATVDWKIFWALEFGCMAMFIDSCLAAGLATGVDSVYGRIESMHFVDWDASQCSSKMLPPLN